MQTRGSPELPSFEEARAIVDAHLANLPLPAVEEVPLLDADGRVLASEIRADRDFPPFHRATRDGFAVRAADVARTPAKLSVLGELAAGTSNHLHIEAQQAAEIMTGAPLPGGADAVVMVEYTRREGRAVFVERSVRAGENFVPQAAEARAGDLLVPSRTRINPSVIAMAASVGRPKLPVYCRPEVAILATGEELVDLSAAPRPAQIRNSNSYSIAAQVRRAGGIPKILPVARDREESIREGIEAAKSSALLVLSGGVSAGKYDLVEKVLADEGAEFHMTGARIQPGKPIVFGSLPLSNRVLPFFGLPGNPISTMVTFDLFVHPVLSALEGAASSPLRFAVATLAEDFKVAPGLTRFLPAALASSGGAPRVSVIPWHGSGDLAAVVRANCYLVVPPEATLLAGGSAVTLLLKD